MSATVRLAREADIPALQRLDRWPREHVWRHKIAGGEVLVLELDARIIGLVRYELLWTTVPLMSLIEIEPEQRGKGYSRLLLEFLKTQLRAEGRVALLSSSQTDEPEAQRWHLHMGFHSNGIIENIMDEGVGELVYRLML
jgi:N-acetylglutamate synthase-like GNAT family acetyltransferase